LRQVACKKLWTLSHHTKNRREWYKMTDKELLDLIYSAIDINEKIMQEFSDENWFKCKQINQTLHSIISNI